MITHEETWYTIQSSLKGADDWYALSRATFDSLEAARQALDEPRNAEYEFRIVKVTHTEEPVT